MSIILLRVNWFNTPLYLLVSCNHSGTCKNFKCSRHIKSLKFSIKKQFRGGEGWTLKPSPGRGLVLQNCEKCPTYFEAASEVRIPIRLVLFFTPRDVGHLTGVYVGKYARFSAAAHVTVHVHGVVRHSQIRVYPVPSYSNRTDTTLFRYNVVNIV